MARLIVKSGYIKPGGSKGAGGYLSYIGTRERVEILDEDYVNLDGAMAELQNHTGNVWTHIFSLRREDAVRLGYDHVDPWRDLLRSKRNDIAAA